MDRHARHALGFTLAAIASAAATANNARAETSASLTIDAVYCGEVFPAAFHGGSPVLSGSFCTPSPAAPAGVGRYPWAGTEYSRYLIYYYRFSYADDGLPTSGSTFESATLSFQPLLAANSPSSSLGYAIDVRGAPADAVSIDGSALVLGRNDHADSFSGTIRVDITSNSSPGALLAGLTPVWTIDSVSDGNVAPIPEPGTYALMLAGLGAIVMLRRRRSEAQT